MGLAIKRTGPPLSEPVTLSSMKIHLNIEPDFTDDDELISEMVSAAREDAEDFTGKSYSTQQWLYALDFWPAYQQTSFAPSSDFGPGSFSSQAVSLRYAHSHIIALPFPPLLTVDSIVYTDTNAIVTTLNPILYQVDAIGHPGRICPAPGGNWPTVAPILNAIQITFTSGYTAVPYRVKQAIRLRAAAYYANREEFIAGVSDARPEWFERALAPDHGGQMFGFVNR